MFIDRAERDLSTTILGTRMPAPVLFAPVGRQKLAHPDGELASARAAAAPGAHVHPVAAGQLLHRRGRRSERHGISLVPDRLAHGGDLDLSSLRRARAAGYTHLLITPPRAGRSWKPLRRIRKSWDGPILLRGVQTARDAKLAAKRRFDGIVVSNHGGRQGDAAIGSVHALPRIADAVGDRLAVLFDSGVRTGTDTYKALALGADAVLVGRPYVYGLALDGQAGVTHVLRTLLAEFDLTSPTPATEATGSSAAASLARARY